MSGAVNFDHGPKMAPFMKEVQKVLVQQPDYKGCGGHDLQDHGKHGLHTQTSIGIGNKTVNFREQK